MNAGHAVPDRAVTFTRSTLLRYAEVTGDHNVVHVDPDGARSAGLPGVIAHGMLTFGTALAVVTDAVPGEVLACHARFVRPVHVPDEGGVEVVVSAVVTTVVEGRVALDVVASVGDTVVMQASCEIG